MKKYLTKYGYGISMMVLAVAAAATIGSLIGIHGKVVELHHDIRRVEAMTRLALDEANRYHIKCVETVYRLDGEQLDEIRLVEDAVNLLGEHLSEVRDRLDRLDLERKLQAMLAKGETAADPADEPRSTIVLPDVD